MRAIFVVTFGLLPLWLAIALITYAYMKMSGEHAGMTLWSLVVAIPACALTLSVAGITLAVHENTSGDKNRKRKFALSFLLVSIIAFVLWANWMHMQKQDQEAHLRWEQDRVQEFVSRHPTITAIRQQPVKTSISTYRTSRSDSMPIEYDVSIEGNDELHAIVTVNRKVKPAEFAIACTTHLHMGQRDPSKDSCAQ